MLEKIGFYTLEDSRAKNISPKSPMWRCELLVTSRCNFKCPYCRGPAVIKSDAHGDMPFSSVALCVSDWAKDGLKNIRFSGGEPTLYPYINHAVKLAKEAGVQRIAISTNGSASQEKYEQLLAAGVNDFSVSLDACCASKGDSLAGVSGKWETVVNNIQFLSKHSYVTVGVVLSEQNLADTVEIIHFANSLGVSDVRIIPSAQENKNPAELQKVRLDVLEKHPILKYRITNFLTGRRVRGISNPLHNRCYLVQDDSAVAGQHHFPCIIYMREGGNPIGKIGAGMRQERIEWFKTHNIYDDQICRTNCLDVCVDFNERCKTYAENL